MALLKNMEFINCHVCDELNDVSVPVYTFNRCPEKDIIVHTCTSCKCPNSLVITIYGLRILEKLHAVKIKQNGK